MPPVPIKVLILGAGGMLGNAIFRLFSSDVSYDVLGTLRTGSKAIYFSGEQQKRLVEGVDVSRENALLSLFSDFAPSLVINCVGIIKQHEAAKDSIAALSINAMLPHRLARYCDAHGARLVHMSTDCVFSGRTGMYVEGDFADADDLYGRTKYLGETKYENTITLRTSIIGHELGSSHSLVDWFLGQEDVVKGYRKAIFSGLPTVEVARVIRDFVLPNPEMSGVYHLSAEPISKHDLLGLVAKIYKKQIKIVADDEIAIDRSLDSTRFRDATGYKPASWPDLIDGMYRNRVTNRQSIGSPNLE